jgi:hypothetical protein
VGKAVKTLVIETAKELFGVTMLFSWLRPTWGKERERVNRSDKDNPKRGHNQRCGAVVSFSVKGL